MVGYVPASVPVWSFLGIANISLFYHDVKLLKATEYLRDFLCCFCCVV